MAKDLGTGIMPFVPHSIHPWGSLYNSFDCNSTAPWNSAQTPTHFPVDRMPEPAGMAGMHNNIARLAKNAVKTTTGVLGRSRCFSRPPRSAEKKGRPADPGIVPCFAPVRPPASVGYVGSNTDVSGWFRHVCHR